MQAISFFNRHTQQLETENVYGEGFLKFAYGNPIGKLALHLFIKRPFFSKWYGWRMNQASTQQKVIPFIQQYGLNTDEFADEVSSYSTFNEFFYRKLKASARPIEPAPNVAVFPADGRHFGFEKASAIQGVFIKGQRFNLAQLLQSQALADEYADGSLILSRLCPVDYHRFHFPVEGLANKPQTLKGPLFSVSPIALRQSLSYLWTNQRSLTTIHSDTFGKVLMLEIGATCVGSILSTFPEEQQVEKGAEKGYFAFGGSSTLTLFQPNRVQLAQDLIENSLQNRELYAKMGTSMATAKP